MVAQIINNTLLNELILLTPYLLTPLLMSVLTLPAAVARGRHRKPTPNHAVMVLRADCVTGQRATCDYENDSATATAD